MFYGFNNKKRSSIGGDFDRDGVKNIRDCEPLNWRKQGPEHDEEVDIEKSKREKEIERKQLEEQYRHNRKIGLKNYDDQGQGFGL